MPVSEFLSAKVKKEFYVRECKKCNVETQFVRIFSPTSSKIKRDKTELIAEAKEEARKVVDKIKMGDTKTILDVYGDKA